MVTKRRDFVLGTSGIAALGKLQAAASLRRVNLGNQGLEFVCHLGVGSQPQVSGLRNRATGFNWCGPGKGSPAGTDDRKVAAWNQAAPNEIRIDYDARSNLSSSQLYRLSADLPVIACAGEFRNASSQAIPNLTEFGCIQLPLRGDLGPLQVHCVSRDSYMVQRVPVGDSLVLEGGGWNSPKYCGLLILECMDSREFLFAGIQWERGWRYQLKKTGGALLLEITLADLDHTVSPGESLAAPQIFLGVSAGAADTRFVWLSDI